MVLQQKVPISIWGRAKADQKIEIKFQNQIFTGTANKNGNFLLKIGPFKVDQGSDLKVSTVNEQIILSDVAVGEVWLCAGQSNMEFPLGYDRELAKEEAALPQNIRYFDYPEVAYEGELNDADYHHFGFWRKATKHDLKYFTAVGYYFAKRLSQNLPNVPIGLLACNWGGTLVSCWMDKEHLFKAGAKNIWQDYQNQIKNLNVKKYKAEFKKRTSNFRTTVFENEVVNWIMTNVSMDEIDGRLEKEGKSREPWVPQPIGPYFEWRPCGLYQTMLLHVVPFTIKGVLWYQGESDANYATQYRQQLVQLINNWREVFQNKKMPFLIVQLAPFIHQFGDWGNNWPIIRNAQQWVADHVPYTALAVITDSGMKWNIHPVYKRNVGTRLALQALNKVYQQDIPCEAPRIKNAILNRNNKELTVIFSNCYDGLNLNVSRLKLQEQKEFIDGLTIIQDGIFYDHVPIKRIEQNKIIFNLIGFDLEKKMIISLAEKDYYCVNLKNSAGIPVRPGIVEPILMKMN